MGWCRHLRWDYKPRPRRALSGELVFRYTRGADTVQQMRSKWKQLSPYVDAERHAQVDAFLGIQEREAQWWRDASIAYFQDISGRPMPAGFEPPAHSLDYYRALDFPFAPGDGR